MISTFTVFFDANVFFGARLRSLVLYLAQTKLFRARWSDAIHDEWIRGILAKRPDLTADQLQRTRELMNAAIPDCLVTGYEAPIPALNLPDPDDRHVLAAAVVTRAHLIVTFNEADFPAPILEPLRLAPKHPDNFMLDTFSLEPSIFLEAVRNDFLHYLQLPLSYEGYLADLAAAGIPETAKVLREYGILVSS